MRWCLGLGLDDGPPNDDDNIGDRGPMRPKLFGLDMVFQDVSGSWFRERSGISDSNDENADHRDIWRRMATRKKGVWRVENRGVGRGPDRGFDFGVDLGVDIVRTWL